MSSDEYEYKHVDRETESLFMNDEQREAYIADGWEFDTQYSVLNDDGVKRERYRFRRKKRAT